MLLEWSAHGLRYGILARAGGALADGRHTVVNVSRGVLDAARERLQPVKVISIEVPEKVLRARLVNRGREEGDDIEQRLERAMAFKIAGPDVTVIRNDSTIDAALGRFLTALMV